jgi:hypothetical protein
MSPAVRYYQLSLRRTLARSVRYSAQIEKPEE